MRPQHLVLLSTCLLFAFGQRGLKKEKPAEYPPGLDEDGRRAFVEEFQKGQVLYDRSCGSCHNVRQKGRTIIPDFSLPQLLDYEMRFQYPAHEDRVREVDVSVEELDAIQAFLQYRGKSGVPVAPLPILPPSQRQ